MKRHTNGHTYHIKCHWYYYLIWHNTHHRFLLYIRVRQLKDDIWLAHYSWKALVLNTWYAFFIPYEDTSVVDYEEKHHGQFHFFSFKKKQTFFCKGTLISHLSHLFNDLVSIFCIYWIETLNDTLSLFFMEGHKASIINKLYTIHNHVYIIDIDISDLSLS